MTLFALYQQGTYFTYIKIFRGVYETRELAQKAMNENIKHHSGNFVWHIEIIEPNKFVKHQTI